MSDASLHPSAPQRQSQADDAGPITPAVDATRASNAAIAADFGGTATLIERTIVLLLFLGLLTCVVLVLLPLATAILFGTVLAIASWPLRSALVRRGLGAGTSSAILLVGMLVLIGLPMVAAAPRLADAVAESAVRLQALVATFPAAPPERLMQLPLVGRRFGRWWQDLASSGGDLQASLAPYASWLRGTALTVVGDLAASVLQLLMALIVAATFWAKGEAVAAVLRDVMRRLGGGAAVAGLEAAGASLRSVAYGVIGTACLQGLFMTLGAFVAGVPAPGLLGFVVMLLAISQIGAVLIPLVWGGATWWLFQQGASGWGVFMLLWGAVMVSMSDNLIRPMLIRRGVEMPMTLVILGVFGGFLSFGFLGLFIGPAGLAVAYTLLQTWRIERPPAAPSPPPS
jgi:predicted PurR-regulated permease PerM